VLLLKLDVRSEDEAQQAASEAVAAFGRIDVVVNSAGYGLFGLSEFGPIEKRRINRLGDIFDTNFFGVLNVLRATLPVLRRQRSGHVFQISSLFGQMSYPGTGLLAATKHAVGGYRSPCSGTDSIGSPVHHGRALRDQHAVHVSEHIHRNRT
jgi:NADP-dependent 3-hydroxy acid dehydrogenase YdfG